MKRRIKNKKHKKRAYIDELGIETPQQFSTNGKSNLRKKERMTYGFDARETYSLDSTMDMLLYERLKMYLKVTDEIINLTFHKFKYKNKIKTQEEMINILIDKLKVSLQKDMYELTPSELEYISDRWEIWSLIHRHMWW